MPTTYLGMPLGSEHKAGEIWDGVLEKIEKRLARWKAQYISLGGKLILINSVLDALPTEDHALWREVIRHKFGELNPWCTNVSTDTYGVGVWKTIRALWPKLEGNLQKRVGDGKRIKFWKDAWKEQSPLMEIFPDVFILSNNPDGTIYDMWSAQGWNLFFRRLLNDWEIDIVADLLNRIDDFNGTTAEPDTLRWKHNIDGQFSVKRVYKMEERVQCRGQPKIWRNLWNSPSPTKVKCFTWLVVKRACLTQEVLKKKGAIIVSRDVKALIVEMLQAART
ncbi:hypothetical protein MTR67_012751 [Solanum verrucosum]|uniref:Reverse transcriptase zinc-binding domain-containing protein n=1 Tax=Solanum verrucosum TaxID=315347 RepID=A0AAF0Q9S2_SOLVR|nr:hypothetical protein MTR67_012751 [Solanum verrucosum]